MSRSTQYIGLTADGSSFVSNAISSKRFKLTEGMFGEDIDGFEYTLKSPDNPNQTLIAREEVQDEPWSSGPMIFTHLKLTSMSEDGSEKDLGYMFSWVRDSTTDGEVDYEKGFYWV